MAAHSEARDASRPQQRDLRSEQESRSQDPQPPSANHFIKIHQSHIPWEGDGIDIHEDERYETPAGADDEGTRKILEHFRILYGDERSGLEPPG
jgi:hypothetical protein